MREIVWVLGKYPNDAVEVGRMRGVIEGGCQIVVVMHEVTEGRNLGDMWGFALINLQISHVWGTSYEQIPQLL